MEDDAIIKAFDERVDRLIQVFGGRHDLHRRDTAQIQQRITELAEHFTMLERRIDAVEHRIDELGHLGIEIQRATTHTQLVARELWGLTHPGEPMPQPPPPMPDAPRPKAIDEACAAAPGEPPTVVRLPRYGATLVPEQGADPETVWSNTVRSLNTTEGSNRGLRGSRRPRGR